MEKCIKKVFVSMIALVICAANSLFCVSANEIQPRVSEVKSCRFTIHDSISKNGLTFVGDGILTINIWVNDATGKVTSADAYFHSNYATVEGNQTSYSASITGIDVNPVKINVDRTSATVSNMSFDVVGQTWMGLTTVSHHFTFGSNTCRR